MLIALPTGGIAKIGWTEPEPMAFVSRNRWTGSRTVGDLGGVRAGWRATIDLIPGKAARHQAWLSFFRKMRGPVNTVQIPASVGVQPGPSAATWPVLGSGQTSNVVRRSQEMGVSPWGYGGTTSITANSTLAPDGTMSVDTINTPTAGDGIGQTTALAVTPLVAYTFSIWLAGTVGQTCYIQMNTSTGVGGSSGATITLTGTLTRYSVTFVPSAGATGFLNVLVQRVGAQTATAIRAWGAQGEIGSIATDYVPTTSAAVVSSSAFLVWGLISGVNSMTEGQLLTINDRLLALTGNVIADSQGIATVPVSPNLPALTASGNVAYVQRPYCLMQLAGGPHGFTASPGGVYLPEAFELEEVIA